MKGYCIECKKNYVRLDKHKKRKHSLDNFLTTEKKPLETKSDKKETGLNKEVTVEVSQPYPCHLYLSEKYLESRPPQNRVPIEIDEQSYQLAKYLHSNGVRSWLKTSSNTLTLLSLARMIHLINYGHIAQPSCHPPVDLPWLRKQIKLDQKSNPKKMRRLKAFFRKMNKIITKFKSLFLKYPDLVKILIKNYI